MKRSGFLVFIGFLVFALLLAACGSGSSSNGSSGQAGSSSTGTSSSNTSSTGTSSSGASNAAETKPFYSSRDVIEIVVPFDAGGGTDAVARLFQKYLPNFIDGNPKVQVVNIPGSGGVKGANDYAQRKPDGYSLLQSSTSLIMQYVLGAEALKLDYKTQLPLIATPGPGVTVVSNKVYSGDPKELLNIPKDALIYGSQTPGGASAKTVLMLEFLKLADKTKFVWGYEGTSNAWLAFQQGEITVHSTPANVYLNTIVDEGIAVPLAQIGYLDENGIMHRHPELSDVPTIIEVYREMYGEEPSGPLFDAVNAMAYVDELSKSLYMPKDAPAEAIAAIKNAMEKMVQDKEFRSEAYKVLESENMIIGESLDKRNESFNKISEDSLNYIRKLLAEKYGVKGLKY